MNNDPERPWDAWEVPASQPADEPAPVDPSAHEVLPGLVAAHIRNKGGRPKSPTPKKVVTIRLDSDVVDQLKAGGAG